MKKFLKQFERLIIYALLAMMVIVVLISTLELAVTIIRAMVESPDFLLLSVDKTLHIFSRFLTILIGLELIEATKIYLEEEAIYVEVIFLVAIIAITRKIIILDIDKYSPIILFGIASLVIALSVGYYFLKQAFRIPRLK